MRSYIFGCLQVNGGFRVRHYFLSLAISFFGMKILFFLIALILLLSSSGYTQKQLVLVKGNKVLAKINEGDYIRFKRKDRDHFTKGFIGGIHQDHFRIGEDTTYLYNVEAVDARGRATSGFKIRQSGVMLIVVGSALLLIDAVNSDEVSPGTVAVSGAFIASGIVMQFVNDDIFKITRKKKMIVMGN